MEGTSIPYLKNRLRNQVSLADRVENGRLIADLIEHPGWAVLEEFAQIVADHGAENLQKIATDVALSADVQARLDFARKRGVQDAVAFHPDVATTLLESAKTAASELKRDAEAESAAAGGQ